MSLNQRIQAIILGALIATTHISYQQEASDDTRRHQDATRLNPDSSGSGIAGFLLAKAGDKLNISDGVDSLLAELLARVGPDMRPMRDFRDFDDITPEVAKRAWLLMHDHAQLALAERMQFMRPIVVELLKQANVSTRCSAAAISVIEAAQRLDSWAVQLLAAWGNFPPIGLYEGTFGDIGSYHGCLNVPENPVIGHAHYCSISYRPILATRADYEPIVRQEPPELLHLFDRGPPDNDDAFTELLAGAQYHHYVYYKLGTCFPIDCNPFDVKSLAKLVGRRSILMSGPVKCHSKRAHDYLASSNGSLRQLEISTRDLNEGVYIWKPHITRTQVVALTVVVAISLFIVLMTIVDLLTNVLPRKSKFFVRKFEESTKNSGQSVDRPEFNLELKHRETLHMDLNNNDVFNLTTDCPSFEASNEEFIKEAIEVGATSTTSTRRQRKGLATSSSIAEDFSIFNNVRQFLESGSGRTRNEISCINGIRCITMSWIVTTHTMQYNDWSAFARTRQVEGLLQSLVNQPLFNGSYLVDSFFLVSGLLTAYSTFGKSFRTHEVDSATAGSQPTRRMQRERMRANFSWLSYLVGRYLRLTPQIIFVSLLFILLPLLNDSGGPHWYTITGEYSENCAQNWWVNLFHVQAFYRSSQMCNFVGWWISVDMLYHLFALAIILLVLHAGHKMALLSCALLTIAHGVVQASRHYRLGLPPNLLSTIPQTGAMWSQMTLEFFWTPYAHALPYFFGFYLGYLMARDHSILAAWFNARRALLGWSLTLISLAVQSYSTYFWVVGKWRYSALESTAFHLVAAAVWTICLAWIVLACHFGYGGPINRLLSCKLFAVLGKASYVVYLSHFLVLFTFFGSQNLLLEPTRLTMLYIIVGNVFFAMLLGSLLSAVYEAPWLKMQRRIMRHIR